MAISSADAREGRLRSICAQRSSPATHSSLAVLVVCAVAIWTLWTGGAVAKGADPSLADLAASVTDAVVNISAVTNKSAPLVDRSPDLPGGEPFDDLFDQYFRRRMQPPDGSGASPARPHSTSLGSGFVVDPSGVVVTNDHVIEGADDITVIFTDGRKLKAQIVGKDQKVDLAVLQVKTDKPLKFVKFGDSDAVRVGDPVIAVGNPFGLGGTVTAGIVSARNRVIDDGPYDDYIQTDASINKGNSGGPLFDMAGEVIGVNTAILSPSGGSIGIGFSAPSSEVALIVDQLRTYHEVRRGWLGVRVQEVSDDDAASVGSAAAKGALISSIDPDGPAKAAGLQVGDIVTSFDGKPVKASRDLPSIVAFTPVGKKVAVVALRSGKQQTLQVVVGRLKDDQTAANPSNGDQSKGVAVRTLGLALSALDPAARSKYGFPSDLQGALVASVDPDSAAATLGLKTGDVIEQANGRPIASASDFADRVQQLLKTGRSTVLLFVARPNGPEQTIALPLK